MINGTTGDPHETMKMLAFDPDWILIDDVGQLQRSLQRAKGESHFRRETLRDRQ